MSTGQFDEHLHPRGGKGSSAGGRFISKGRATTEDASKAKARAPEPLHGGNLRIPSDKHLNDYLSMVSRFRTETSPGQASTEKMVLDNGVQFRVTPQTFKGKRYTAKLCYMNAAKIAMSNPDRTYVEGFITLHGVPIQHAWTVDKKGNVFDTTIKESKDIQGYFGVPFETDYVAKTALKTKVWGIISHTNRDLFDANSLAGIVKGAPKVDTVAEDLLSKNFSDKETFEKSVLSKIAKADLDRMAKADEEIKGMTPTNVKYVQGDGTYTPERQALHAKILEDMFTPEAIKKAMPAKGEVPILVLTGGRPAAGKTSALKSELSDEKNSFYISADTIQEHLPGYKAEYAGIFNGEGQDIALQAESIAMKAGMNFTYDATMKSTQPAIDRVKLYKANGYKVHGYFVHTTPTMSALRSVERFKATGRYVPPIVSFKSRSNETTFDKMIPILDKWALYDNNGRKPVRVAGGGNG
jgi:predicted ABC-type ATPase